MKHDRRENIWANQDVNEDLKQNNEYRQTRALEDIKHEHEKLIKAKTGRGMQKKTMDVREGVIELPDNASIDDLWHVGECIASTPILRSTNVKKIVDWKSTLIAKPLLDERGKQVKSPLGIKLFAACLHRDEGHWIRKDGQSANLRKGKDGKWYDPYEEVHNPKTEGLVWERHIHGHLWFDVIDHNTGRTIRPSVEELSQLQTVVAFKLGMQRGEVGSKRKRDSQQIYVMKKIAANLDKELTAREKRKESLDEQIKDKEEMNEKLQEKNEELASIMSQIDTMSKNLRKEEERLATIKKQEAEDYEHMRETQAEHKRLMLEVDKLKAIESPLKPIIVFGLEIKANILSRLKEVFAKHEPDKKVLDFEIHKESFKYTDLHYAEAEGECLKYIVKTQDREGKIWKYTALENDYYESKNKLITEISALFSRIKDIASLLIANNSKRQPQIINNKSNGHKM